MLVAVQAVNTFWPLRQLLQEGNSVQNLGTNGKDYRQHEEKARTLFLDCAESLISVGKETILILFQLYLDLTSDFRHLPAAQKALRLVA